MSSTLKVDILQDSGGNNLVTSNGSGVITAAGFGKIGQVVTERGTTSHNTSSTSFVATGFSVTITPSSTSSKILLVGSFPMFAQSGGSSTCHAVGTIFRGGVASGTNLGRADYGMWQTYTGADNQIATCALCHLDSPATTSATEYEVAILRQGTGLCYLSTNSDAHVLTAMEVLP